MSAALPKIAILYGGMSSERAVSLSSGQEVAAALHALGYTFSLIDVGHDIAHRLEVAAPDVVFNALHGTYGEDGRIQGLLDMMGLNYTHSGVLSSAIAMDKVKTKVILERVGIRVPQSKLSTKVQIEAGHIMPLPYVIKPYNEGSSVGIFIVKTDADKPKHLPESLPDMLMVESYVQGRELTVAVLGDRALSVTEIFSQDWYDYDSKYKPGASRHEVPANIPDAVAQICLDWALLAHQTLGCKGVSRSDFRYDETQGLDGVYFLETNTHPGLTPTSLVPEQARHHGMSFEDLISWMVKDAACCR